MKTLENIAKQTRHFIASLWLASALALPIYCQDTQEADDGSANEVPERTAILEESKEESGIDLILGGKLANKYLPGGYLARDDLSAQGFIGLLWKDPKIGNLELPPLYFEFWNERDGKTLENGETDYTVRSDFNLRGASPFLGNTNSYLALQVFDLHSLDLPSIWLTEVGVTNDDLPITLKGSLTQILYQRDFPEGRIFKIGVKKNDAYVIVPLTITPEITLNYNDQYVRNESSWSHVTGVVSMGKELGPFILAVEGGYQYGIDKEFFTNESFLGISLTTALPIKK